MLNLSRMSRGVTWYVAWCDVVCHVVLRRMSRGVTSFVTRSLFAPNSQVKCHQPYCLNKPRRK